MYCRHCGSDIKRSKFCMACGKRASDLPRAILIISVLAVVFAIIALTFSWPAMQIVNKTTESTIVKELVKYPTEEVTQEPFKFIVVNAANITRYYNYSAYTVARIELKNTDTETGYFRVNASFENLKTGQKRSSQLGYVIDPRQTKLFYFEFQQGELPTPYIFKYDVLPPLKNITKTTTKLVEIKPTNAS
ncbi:MAG: hypothetical protein HYT16_02085 [DPANN group archaeon]|nr:hypothetical protein [DPANN group archaeon]